MFPQHLLISKHIFVLLRHWLLGSEQKITPDAIKPRSLFSSAKAAPAQHLITSSRLRKPKQLHGKGELPRHPGSCSAGMGPGPTMSLNTPLAGGGAPCMAQKKNFKNLQKGWEHKNFWLCRLSVSASSKRSIILTLNVIPRHLK